MTDANSIGVSAARPTRICPGCGTAEAFDPSGFVWPLGWNCLHCGWVLSQRNGLPALAPKLDGVISGMDPSRFADLNRWESRHFWFRARNEMIGWLIAKYAGGSERVMEIGCGTGMVLGAIRRSIPQAKLVGSELHSAGLAFARQAQTDEVEFVQMDARHLHVQNTFDLICAFDVVEHIDDDAAVLGQVAAALKPGGLFFATVPQHPWLWSYADEIAFHARRYRSGELGRKARRAGLIPIRQDSFVVILLPLMMLSRLAFLRGKSAKDNDEAVARETELPAGLNAFLLGLLRLEHGLRRIGMRWPIGGSQVLVARKAV